MMIFIQLLPVLISLCCVIAAILLRRSVKGSVRNPVYTQAVVVSKVTQIGYRHHSTVEQSAPVLRYMTEQGERTAVYQRYVPEWQYNYHNGDTVQICYDQKNSGNFRICHDQSDVWKSNLLLCIAFGTLLAYAVLWIQYH
ncbi:MAG: DUF3592 domain-containing protein [Ruminococcus sp.]|nr:DUF3592 domain-containing protein [Ruminococcus sp.]